MRVLFALALTGCMVSPLGGSSAKRDAGASTDAGISDAAAALTPDAATLQGGYCGKDPQSGVELCLAVSACPDLVIDSAQFPECGYRVRGQAYDLVCLCQDYLCPIGLPQTCKDVESLLREQSVISVCGQINEGRCVPAKAQ